MKYKVNKLKSKNIKKFFELLKKYNSKHQFLKNKSFFKWQYLNKSNYNGYIFSQKKTFSAFQLFIPYKLYDLNLSKRSIFLTNFYSQGIHLAAGYIVFKKILKELLPNFVGSSGIWSKKLIKYHQKLGFKTGYLNHFIFVSPYRKIFKIIINKKKKKISRVKTFQKFKNNYSDYKSINKDNIFTLKHKIKFDFIPFKSIKYINRRYLTHPEFNYKVFSFSKKNNLIRSMVVLRVLRYNSSSIIKIVEFFGDSKHFYEYKNLFLYLLKIYNSEYISFYNLGIKNSHIKKSNFKLIKGSIVIYPDLFNPLIKENVVLSYAYKNLYPKKVRLFLGDGDRDKPN